MKCSNHSACDSCGWNPDSGVRERRVLVVLRDRQKNRQSGKKPTQL